MSKNENVNSGTGEDTDTVKGIEKQMLYENTTTQVLIERERNECIQLLQTYIPVNVKVNELVTSLIGKWFNKLRWVGMIEGETGYMLQWINEDDGYNNSFQVNLKIVCDYIVIETNAVSEKEKIEAMVGSSRMLQHIIRLFENKLGVSGEYMINLNQYLPNKNN